MRHEDRNGENSLLKQLTKPLAKNVLDAKQTKALRRVPVRRDANAASENSAHVLFFEAMNQSQPIHSDLIATKTLVYDPGWFQLTEFRLGTESTEYAACAFRLNGASICFRVAKTTPVKAGQFVTLWKRIGTCSILPFDSSDDVDFYVVSTRDGSRFGQFVFPRSVLRERDVLSHNGKGGKRTIRVYPPWDTATSRQAQVTQSWQLRHFLEIGEEGPLDHESARMLYAHAA